MTYKVIHNNDHLMWFLQAFFGNYPKDSCIYGTFFARKKYDETSVLKSDKAQLKTIIGNNPTFFYQKLLQLELPLGLYFSDGVEVPENTTAVYVNPNFRSYEKAKSNLLNECLIKDEVNINTKFKTYLQTNSYHSMNLDKDAPVDALNTITFNGKTYLMIDSSLGKDFVNTAVDFYYETGEVLNPETILGESVLGKKRYIDFDFDIEKSDSFIPSILEKVNSEAVSVIETRSGYHVLVTVEKITKNYKRWYKDLSEMKGCDSTGDNLIPCPGTIQGGFNVKMILHEGFYM